MIRSKLFEDEASLNEFIKTKRSKKIKIISITTEIVKTNTGLPLPRGGTFVSNTEMLKVFYEEDE